MQYFWAFVVGGLICVAGQLLIDLTALTPARVLTGYVVAGVVLSAIGWYAPLAEFAGCGATVPLLGFGHLLAKGVKTAIEEEGAIGILTGGLTAAAAVSRRRGFVRQSESNQAFLLARLAIRLILRLAVFFLMTPLARALSIAETAARTVASLSAAFASMAASAFLTTVFRLVLMALL